MYYGKDPTELWAHEAIRLIERLPHYWQVIPETDPPRVLSAVHAHSAEVESERVMSNAELASLGVNIKEV